MTAPSAPHALFAARSMSQQSRAEMRQAFDEAIKLADKGRLVLRVPHSVKSVQNKRGMHYHYRPEIFLGLSGTTNFSFPKEGFVAKSFIPDRPASRSAISSPVSTTTPSASTSRMRLAPASRTST